MRLPNFDDAKRCRNRIVHGDPFDEAAIPTESEAGWVN
jgi:hypothetical protein